MFSVFNILCILLLLHPPHNAADDIVEEGTQDVNTYVFHSRVGQYNEVGLDGNPVVMEAFERFSPTLGENKWESFVKTRALNSLSNSICRCDAPLDYVFSAAKFVPGLLDYFGSQFNVFLTTYLCKYFSTRVKAVTSIVDHKFQLNTNMNSAIFLYPEIKNMIDRVIRKEVLPSSTTRTLCTFAPPLSSTFLLFTMLASISTDSLTTPISNLIVTRVIVGTIGELQLGLAIDGGPGGYGGIADVTSRSYSNIEAIANDVERARTCDLAVVDGSILTGVAGEAGLRGIKSLVKDSGTLFIYLPGNTIGGERVGKLLDAETEGGGLRVKELKQGAKWQKQMSKFEGRADTGDVACTSLEAFSTAEEVNGDSDFLERQMGEAWVLEVRGGEGTVAGASGPETLSVYYTSCDYPSTPHETSSSIAEEMVHFAESTLTYAETVRTANFTAEYNRIFWAGRENLEPEMWMRFGRGVAVSICSLLVSSSKMISPPNISISILANVESANYLATIVPKILEAFPSLSVAHRIVDITAEEKSVNIFKPCAGGRLLIPQVALQEERAVVYLDADSIFLGKEAVEGLMGIIEELVVSEDKVVAAGDEHGCKSSSSWYGSGEGGGINSGVLVLDLEKVKDKGLPETWIGATKNYDGDWGDQDVLNDSLRKDQILELPCKLNYRPDSCYFDVFDCDRCPLGKGGGLILQGTRSSHVPKVHDGTIYVPAWGETYYVYGKLVDSIIAGVKLGSIERIVPPGSLGTINSHVCKGPREAIKQMVL
mmetsp:Transcript_22502/g.46759  ORF Transcript_22502/g.46759 Transcript_22502/m.46759 type:complete len:768 (+) Transcript_22502:101-2404(+)